MFNNVFKKSIRAGVRVPLKRTAVRRYGRKNHGKNFHSFVTVMCPIEGIDECSKTEAIEKAMAEAYEDSSPLRQCNMLHMVRLHLVDNLWPALGQTTADNLKTRYLLMIADIDGEPADFYDCLYRIAPQFVQDVWGRCMEYPQYKGAVFFRRYMQRCSLKTQLPFAAFPDSLPDIQTALDTQRRLVSWLSDDQEQTPARRESWEYLMSELDQRAEDLGAKVLRR